MGPFEMLFRIGPRNEILKESINQLILKGPEITEKGPEINETNHYGKKQLYLEDNYHVVIVKSTVVPGTTDDIVKPILEQYSKKIAGIFHNGGPFLSIYFNYFIHDISSFRLNYLG